MLYSRKLALLTLAFAFVLGYAPPSSARTITVDSSCSLADAITAANTDTAIGGCAAGLASDSIVLSADITLSATLPTITSRITIEGQNYEISGNDSYRIFSVSDTGRLTIENTTLADGNSSSAGGAIAVLGGRLTVENSVFRDNRASDDGGAIAAGDILFDEGFVDISGSTFDNNDSGNDGGAIRSFDSVLDITNSTFTNNSADSDGGAIDHEDAGFDIIGSVFRDNSADSDGGAISFGAFDGNEIADLEIEESVFAGNSAGNTGGAIYSVGSQDELEIDNTTFSNNSAVAAGSAIFVSSQFNPPNARLRHVTIVGNSSESLYDLTYSGTVNLRNSILYNMGSGAACAGRLDENVNNIIEDGSCSNPPSLSVNPQLGAFTGSYYPLLAGSPAIDAAASQCLSRDQRGVRRPQGAGCDIGAYEHGDSGGSRSNPAPQREPETVNQQTVQHNEQMITEHDYGVTTQHGLQTISLRPLNPQDCGAIGNQAVCDMDVLDVADISGWAEQGIRFCFPQRGKVLFMPSHDANGQPINQKTAQPETLPVEVDGDGVCVTINRDGKLILVQSDEPVLPTRTQSVRPAPLAPPTTRLGRGDTGTLFTIVGGLSMRTGPGLRYPIIAELERGTSLLVSDGPRQADNYLWWKTQAKELSIEGWVAEGVTAGEGDYRYFLELVLWIPPLDREIIVDQDVYTEIVEIPDATRNREGILRAIRIYEVPANEMVKVCIPGGGFIVFHDQQGSNTLLQAWQEGDNTCAWVNMHGTVRLMSPRHANAADLALELGIADPQAEGVGLFMVSQVARHSSDALEILYPGSDLAITVGVAITDIAVGKDPEDALRDVAWKLFKEPVKDTIKQQLEQVFGEELAEKLGEDIADILVEEVTGKLASLIGDLVKGDKDLEDIKVIEEVQGLLDDILKKMTAEVISTAVQGLLDEYGVEIDEEWIELFGDLEAEALIDTVKGEDPEVVAKKVGELVARRIIKIAVTEGLKAVTKESAVKLTPLLNLADVFLDLPNKFAQIEEESVEFHRCKATTAVKTDVFSAEVGNDDILSIPLQCHLDSQSGYRHADPRGCRWRHDCRAQARSCDFEWGLR